MPIDRDEYAERAADAVDDAGFTVGEPYRSRRRRYAKVIAEAYAPLHEKLARVTEERDRLREACEKFVKSFASGQREKCDVALRIAKEALAP